MPNERDAIMVNEDGTTSTITASEAREKTVDELTDQEYKDMLIEVLDRGWTSIRLEVALPDDMHGEWVHRDIDSVARMQKLGFSDGTSYAEKRAAHSADGLAGVGDVIFMVTSKKRKKLIDEVQRELYNRRNDPKRGKKGRVQGEEREFAAEVDKKIGLPTIEESDASAATKADIEAALNSK